MLTKHWNSIGSFHLALLLLISFDIVKNVGATTNTMCRELFPSLERESSDKVPCVDVSLIGANMANTILIMISINKDLPTGCEQLDGDLIFALQMINSVGYPMGYSDKTFWDLKNSYLSCKPPTEGVSLWDITNTNMEQIPCFYHEEAKDKYFQPEIASQLRPFLIRFDVPSTITQQIHVVWTHLGLFSAWPQYEGIPFPESLWVVGEVFEKNTQRVFSFTSNEQAQLFPQEIFNPKPKCDKESHVRIIESRPTGSTSPDYIKACQASPAECSYDIELNLATEVRGTPDPNPVVIIGGKSSEKEISPAKRKRLRPSDIYDGCASQTKGCIVSLQGNQRRDCIKGKTCDLVLAFQRQDIEGASDEFVVIELYHADPGEWFAMGINFNADHPRMPNTYVMECVDEGLPEGPVVYNSFNVRGKYDNVRYREGTPQGAQSIIQKQESYRKGRSMYCRFHIKVKFSRTVPLEKDATRDINLKAEPVFILAAWGHQHITGGSGNLLKHMPGHHMKTEKRSILADRFAPTPGQKIYLQLHGVLMTWASLLCFPVGLYIARFWKETFPSVKICRKVPLWLFLHVFLMTAAVVLVSVSMAQEVYGHLHWKSFHGSKIHTFIGGTSGGLLLINFVFGFFVKETYHNDERMNIRGIIHSVLGHLVQVGFGVILLLTDRVPFGDSPCHIKWVVLAAFFTSIAAHVLMTYHYCWVDWIVGLRRGRSYGVRPIGVLTEGDVIQLLEIHRKSRGDIRGVNVDPENENIISAPGARLRVAGAVLLFTLAIMYSGWVSIMILMNKHGPCHSLEQFDGH